VTRGAWDCVVVGAGPAGLSAAIYMGRFRRKTLVLDDAEGRWTYGQRNDNYLGFPSGVAADRLHALGKAQAERFGVVFRAASVTDLAWDGELWTLRAARGAMRARTVIWAAGVRDVWPDFPAARSLIGKQLFWCIVCDGFRTREATVLLFGNDDAAAKTTLQFLTYTPHLTLLVDPERRGPSAAARRKLEADGIPIVRGRVAKAGLEARCLVDVTLEDGRVLPADYLFSLLGSRPRTEPLRGVPIALARNGHVRIDDANRTSHPAFFAAGDVTNKHAHQVVTAAHEGSTAAQAANHVLYPPRQKLETPTT
jgi:thioredoxin reductase (NADPH)